MEHDLAADSVEARKRSHVTVACLNCKKLHVSCDFKRPCSRCSERNKDCFDGECKKRGRKRQSELTPSPTNSLLTPSAPPTVLQNMGLMESFPEILCGTQPLVLPGLDCSVVPEPLPLDFLEDLQFQSPFDNRESAVRSKEVMQQTCHISGEKNETPSTFSRPDCWLKLHQLVCKKLPEKAAIFDSMKPLHGQMMAIREGLKPEAAMEIMKSFDSYITTFGNLFNELGTPSLMWVRSGIIHYMNQAFMDLTGFNSPIPTALDDFAFIEALSIEGLGRYMDYLSNVFLSGRPPAQTDTFTFRTGIKAESSGCIQGILCVTMKRDFLGLPLVFIGNFLPDLL